MRRSSEALYCLYKGSRVSLCVEGMCLITMSMCQLIRTPLLVIITEWSSIGECAALPFLSRGDFRFSRRPQHAITGFLFN